MRDLVRAVLFSAIPLAFAPAFAGVFEDGLSAFDQENYPRASALFRSFIAENPADARRETARLNLAHSLREQDDYAAAAGEYRAFAAEFPNSADRSDAELKVMQCLFEAKGYDELTSYSTQLVADSPQHPHRREILFLEGRMLHDNGRYQEAIDKYVNYLDSTELGDNDNRALLFLAKALTSQAKSVSPLAQAPGAPADLSAQFLNDQAEIYLRILVDQPDINVEDRLWALWLLRDFDKISEIADTYLDQHPEVNRMWLMMQIWSGIGESQKHFAYMPKAKASFEAAINADARSFPDMSETEAAQHMTDAAEYRLLIAEVDRDAQTTADVLDKLRRRIPANDRKAGVLLRFDEVSLARRPFEAGEYAAAVASLRQFIEAFPRHERIAEARFTLARSHDSLGDNQSALAAYQDCLALHPDFEKAPFLRFVIARKLHDLDRPQEALAAYASFIAACPDDENAPNARYYSARALDNLGRAVEATAAYTQFIDGNPDSQHAAEARQYLGALREGGAQ